eukprot:CAMPEP_0185743620 /NCGR_PEP_ID=MMETSP1174-20130828/1403_1 /TAXON_ID=35687 /ORGANISM="Dictyocha speculum, Strain CCMP1381" /LENGTH=214 /DNA_ID=CAMNT_0028416441 /DNA_START=519 /DNA_END=1167 /DNA_ORIENTATION=-
MALRQAPLNGAPKVYFATILIACEGEAAVAAEGAVRALDAVGLRWGATHTEIIVDKDGIPRLVEVNARWHAASFRPLCDAVLGYNALDVHLDAILGPTPRWDAIPPRPPPKLSGAARIVHLVSTVEGLLSDKGRGGGGEGGQQEALLQTLRALPSVQELTCKQPGDMIERTVDIRTDAGQVLLLHSDSDVVEADYLTILQAQKNLFVVESAGDD